MEGTDPSQPTDADAQPAPAWLETFRREHGRPPRILHIGNIANNAYNNAKKLDRIGFDCDVICYDYYHIMGCPEWEDADFSGAIADQFAPDWSRVDLAGFQRPRWFAQGRRTTCMRYLIARREGRAAAADLLWRRMDIERRWMASRGLLRFARRALGRSRREIGRARRLAGRVAGAVRRRRAAATGRVQRLRWPYRDIGMALIGAVMLPVLLIAVVPVIICDAWRLARRVVSPPAVLDEAAEAEFDRRVALLITRFDHWFPDRTDRLTAADFEPYRAIVPGWRRLIEQYDLVEGYSIDPILPMLVGTRPYVAYEHGTIREIPFAADAVGRLTALSYAESQCSIITNPDCEAAARRLGLQQYRFIPHLIDEKYYDVRVRSGGALPPGVREPYVFCPARHDFDEKGTDILIEAFATVARRHPDLQLVLASWGRDLDRSLAMLRDLGIEDRVAMVEPLNIHGLIRVVARASALVDQFHYGVFGGIGPTALAVGTPLVTHLDHAKSAWCMSPPPCFEAFDVPSCRAAIELAVAADGASHAQQQDEWMRGNYWHEDVAARHAEVYRQVLVPPPVVHTVRNPTATAVARLEAS